MSVNTELPMNFSCDSKEEDFDDVLHFYGEMDDHEFHKMMSVDDLTYSTLFNDEILIMENRILMQAWKPVMS